jgi:hypothetical protein
MIAYVGLFQTGLEMYFYWHRFIVPDTNLFSPSHGNIFSAITEQDINWFRQRRAYIKPGENHYNLILDYLEFKFRASSDSAE